MLGPCALPNPEAEAEAEAEADVGRDCSEPNPVARTSTESRLPVRREYSGQSKARPRLRRSPSSSTVPSTRHAIRPAAPSLRLLGLDRMQPVARQRSSVQPVAACAVLSGIVHRWQSVATQCMWLQHCAALLRHTCVAQRQMSRRAAVVAQTSAGDGFGCGADVGKGSTQSRCRCGRGEGLGPGAEVGGYEPSPVVSDERSPKMQMRAYRGEPYQAALRCAHTHSTCMRPAHRAEESRKCTARL